MRSTLPLSVGIGGLGGVGLVVARRLLDGLDGLVLKAVSVRDEEKARRALPGFSSFVAPEHLADACDVVVECLPPAIFRTIAEPAIAAGRVFMPLSVGQLLSHWDLVDAAKASGARILVPSGAILGLDAMRAAAEGTINSVTMVTRKPPAGLAGAPYLVRHGIDIEGLTEALKVFDGTARDGALGFPANVNVAAAVSLAGIGPDLTRLQIWADPAVTRNVHHIQVEADSARFSMTIENVPSEANPRTGRITALSAIATLRGMVAPLKVGT